MLFLVIMFVIIGIAIYSITENNKQRAENIERRKNFVTTVSPTAHIVVNNGAYLFFVDDEKQVFGVDESGNTYSYSGLRSILTGKSHVHISHNNAAWSGLELGKSITSDDAAVPLDRASISAIADTMIPILRKNLYERLVKLNITPTHEYVNKGEIWGCDINSKMFYCTHVHIQIHDFSKLLSVRTEDYSDNSNYVGFNYRIVVTIKAEVGQDDEIWINVNDEETFENLLSMFEEIKERQNDHTYAIGQKNFDMLEGHEFEYFCANLLRKNGYINVTVTQGSGDQGVDLIAYRDGIKYGIQCKCYSSDIGNKAVQEVFAGKAFYECHVGIVLTNRYFTKSAIELAKKNGIILWDRTKLIELIENASIDY